jgi:hypothetical protein
MHGPPFLSAARMRMQGQDTATATVKLPLIKTFRCVESNGGSCMRSYHPG